MVKNVTSTQELYDAIGETSAEDIILIRDENKVIYELVSLTNEEDHGVTIIDVKATK